MNEPGGSTAQRVEQLLSLSHELVTEQSLDRVLERVAAAALTLIGCRYAAIGVLAPDGLMLERFETAGLTRDEAARIGELPRGHGILGLVIREHRVIRLEDLTRHPASHGFPANHPPMKSFLGVPIIGRRGVFGNLYVTEKLGATAFAEEDVHVAQLLAAATAAAVENAMLHEESARLLDEVQQLQRRRERFFAMVNHELRNALAGVYGWAQILTRRTHRPEGPRAAFEVLDSAEQAVALINDLLDLSRLDEDRLKLEIRPLEPVRLAEQAISRVLPAAEEKGVRLELRAGQGVPTVESDPHRVEQVLMNLLVNAIRHTPPGSRVVVNLRAADGRVAFAVEDEGPGVPDGEHDRIFDIYETRPGEGGVGLGLPLSLRLARLLGGTLRSDPGTEQGARFILDLPAAGRS